MSDWYLQNLGGHQQLIADPGGGGGPPAANALVPCDKEAKPEVPSALLSVLASTNLRGARAITSLHAPTPQLARANLRGGAGCAPCAPPTHHPWLTTSLYLCKYCLKE